MLCKTQEKFAAKLKRNGPSISTFNFQENCQTGKSALWTNASVGGNFQRTLSVIGLYEFRGTLMIGPYLFLGKFAWTNGPESSSKVSPCTGVGPWMALEVPSQTNNVTKNRRKREARIYLGLTKGWFSKGWFSKGWFWRMLPRNENRNEGTFGCSHGTKTGTRVHSPKPPFYETALLSPSESIMVRLWELEGLKQSLIFQLGPQQAPP